MIEKIYYFLYFKLTAYKLKLIKKTLKYCGENVHIHESSVIIGADHISLGRDVTINAFVHIWGNGGLDIGDFTMIASHCAITTLTHDPKIFPYKDKTISKKITIGKNVWVGSHTVILPGITIGDNVIVGAGSVVTKDIPNNRVAYGVPAVIIRENVE
ncbi:MAG: acyltransferase [Pedobacter sp.]|nr:MAG: acyltransferase [Pedobacter sp.]